VIGPGIFSRSGPFHADGTGFFIHGAYRFTNRESMEGGKLAVDILYRKCYIKSLLNGNFVREKIKKSQKVLDIEEKR